MAKHVPHRTTPCPASPCNRNYAGSSYLLLLHAPMQLTILVGNYQRRHWLSELAILTCLWTRGSEQVLHRRWASHLHQTVLPVQGYIQLRPQDTTLPSFGGCPAVPAGSVSIFARAPLCPNTCRYCRCKPCDVATDHDDHICYNCEQRQLFPERIPKWEIPDLPICDSWCQECATQRCCSRGAHGCHLCMRCDNIPTFNVQQWLTSLFRKFSKTRLSF